MDKIPSSFLAPRASDVNPDTAKYTVEQVKDIINGIAETLRVPAEQIFSIMVRQQKVHALQVIIMAIISIFGFLFSFKHLKKLKNVKDKELEQVVTAIIAIISGIILVACIANIPSVITDFLNPERGAIHDIVKMFKSDV